MIVKILQTLQIINNRISNIERNLLRLEDKLDFSLAIQRNHLIRLKHNESISDEMILYGRPYNDLTPQQAYKIFRNNDLDFILIDVSENDFQAPSDIEGLLKVSLEDLPHKYTDLVNKTTPILIISENGVRSILGCEFFIKKGYFNINNVSGGHQFWPGHQEHLPQKAVPNYSFEDGEGPP